MKVFQKNQKGFTLIELLVVIAIIGLLASVVLVALNGARKKARIALRVADMQQIVKALELYYNANNTYPNPGWGWRSQCIAWGSTPGSVGFASDQVIPGLVPAYMSKFPADPSMDAAHSTSCFLYLSNGTDYKLLDHNIVPDFTNADYLTHPELVDPDRDGGPAGNGTPGSCVGAGDNSGIWSWALYSPGAQCW